MKTMVVLFAAGALAAGCKKNPSESTTSAAGSGSVTAPKGSATGSAAATPAASAAPKPMSADDLAKRFHDCWGDWGAAKWDAFKGCYAGSGVSEAPGSGMPALNDSAAITEMTKTYRAAFPDEKAASQLVLVNGKKIAAVALLTGKQSGPLKTPAGDLPATNKSFGFYMGQLLSVDEDGKVTHEWDFFDMATLMGQLKPMKDHPVRPPADKLAMPEQVAIAKDDAKEKANVATVQQLVEKFNKHDLKGFGDLIADDVAWSEQPAAKDESKKDLMTNLPQMWKAFSDLKFQVTDAWGAGDYVAATETFEGTNDGDLPVMHVKKTGKKVSLPFLAIHKVDGGKVKATWIFYQGGGFANQLGLDKQEGTKKVTRTK